MNKRVRKNTKPSNKHVKSQLLVAKYCVLYIYMYVYHKCKRIKGTRVEHREKIEVTDGGFHLNLDYLGKFDTKLSSLGC